MAAVSVFQMASANSRLNGSPDRASSYRILLAVGILPSAISVTEIVNSHYQVLGFHSNESPLRCSERCCPCGIITWSSWFLYAIFVDSFMATILFYHGLSLYNDDDDIILI